MLASWVPVVALLRQHGVGVIIVSTMHQKYIRGFQSKLGFDLPGTVVLDGKRATHRACRLYASVYASLVLPFRKHMGTFGTRAIAEALRVSLVNATPGHGSSWQQGATIVLLHEHGVHDAKCTFAWREDYPGDWLPINRVCETGLGIFNAPMVSYPERLDFVIACRNGKASGGSESRAGADGSSVSLPAEGTECKEEVCSIDAMRRAGQAAMARS